MCYYATFTLGVFYDQHARLRAACIRASTLDCPASTPSMQAAYAGLSSVINAADTDVDDGLSAVDARMHPATSCQSI